MPKRIDLKKILIIGSGPIIIGQGCEFDYSGVQACKALRSVGYEIVLINSNPATIMTDPDIADHTYIEPITWQTVAKVIEIERPDAVLSTMGGQTALNCALDLERHGVLAKYNVELIGACKEAIDKAENREAFRIAMQKIGLDMPRSFVANDLAQAQQAQKELGYPTIIRPSYTLGGTGGGIAYNNEEFIEICRRGFNLSPHHQLLIEESLLGWKEFELEVVRDANDSCIIVCTIENLDPMGVHTGDSITVAPAQTLTDKEYQKMRDAAIAILREIGVQTGGSNVQFAVNPDNGRMIVIEMNPRVSRSSALASKATGFPIAKVAALLAVGYTLDELKNDITGGVIPASFEPTIDYVVVKIPRFNFDKFPQIRPLLTTQMQAIGEVMAVGANFQAALQKALCSLEIDLTGFTPQTDDLEKIILELKHAGPLRILYLADALRKGLTIEDIYSYTAIDPWFLNQIANIIKTEEHIGDLNAQNLLKLKQQGFSDARIAELSHTNEAGVRSLRKKYNIIPKFKRIDSCAAEFVASTAYLYSTYEGECEAQITNRKKVIVLGSGPNRIGQGVEFDYCCVQAVLALQQNNIESIMINCNPETVSTDYDTADRLYFESLTLESVLDIVELEQPFGVILQLGGQTPLKLAAALEANNVNILGTAPDMIDLAEDRGRFVHIVNKLQLQQPANEMVQDVASGLRAAKNIGFPLMVRPSYVLGGRAMEIVYNENELIGYLSRALKISNHAPVLIDRFLEQAIEVDVDVLADGQGGILVAGIMEHVEPAGVHSGDSAAVLPAHNLSLVIQEQIKQQAISVAAELRVVGLMNMQFAVQANQIFVLEVNPRASRTVPFVSKSVGISIAKAAVACMLGKSLREQNLLVIPKPAYYAVKQSVFPFIKFPGVDPMLGPEMRSTGEIMAFGATFAQAYQKSLVAVNLRELKVPGCAFVTVGESDKLAVVAIIQNLLKLKFEILVDSATGAMLDLLQTYCTIIDDSDRIVSLMAGGHVNLVISTANTSNGYLDAQIIRVSALKYGVLYTTTVAGANSIVLAMECGMQNVVYKLQNLHKAKVLEYEYE